MLKHFEVVLKRSGQLFLHLMLEGYQLSTVFPMLVDMFHPVITQVKAHTQIF